MRLYNFQISSSKRDLKIQTRNTLEILSIRNLSILEKNANIIKGESIFEIQRSDRLVIYRDLSLLSYLLKVHLKLHI